MSSGLVSWSPIAQLRGVPSLPLRRLAASRLGFGMQPRAPVTTDIVLSGRRPRACRGAAPVRHAPRTRRAPDADRPRAGDALFRHAAGADPRRIHLRAGAYRPGAARRQRRCAADPGGGDGDRPGGAPRRGGRPARVPFDLLSIDIGGEPAMPPGRRRCRSSRSGGSWTRLAALEANCDRRARRRRRRRRRRDANWRWRWRGASRGRVRIVLVCDTRRAAGDARRLRARRSRAPRWWRPAWNWSAA